MGAVSYGVDFELFDGAALAEQLASPVYYWIAERFLALPSLQVLGGMTERAKPDWRPRAARKLIGRDGELTHGRDVVCGTHTRPVLVVTGVPGVGKTEFAIALAESVAERFSDGQYLIEVPASDGGHEPDLLGLLSDAIDGRVVRPEESRNQQRSRLRAQLVGREVVLIFDNVQSEDAVREVLGLGEHLAVICTSRSRLSGLAVDGVAGVELEPLSSKHTAELALATAPRLSEMDGVALSEFAVGCRWQC